MSTRTDPDPRAGDTAAYSAQSERNLARGPVAAAAARRRRIDPACPLDDTRPHNSVRAAKTGCTCPDGVAGLQRERQREKTARPRRETEHPRRKRSSRRDIPSPVVRTRREPAAAPAPTHEAGERERALRGRDDLACRSRDPELWFPLGDGPAARDHERYAKAICARCPAVRLCGEVALEVGLSDGVMGGYSADDRRAIRAARNEQEVA